jgi:short-subunit dehydrogenase
MSEQPHPDILSDGILTPQLRPLAVVTGASSGIGYELARIAAESGYDLVIAADDPGIVEAAQALRALGASVDEIHVDLATEEGIEAFIDLIGVRPPDLLFANAGHGLGRAFLQQDLADILHVIDTNVTGTVILLHRLLPAMVERQMGRVLITGSVAGLIPGSFQAVYNGTKAFLDNFSFALRNELKDTGLTVTCLMPGATDTEFFERADMLDTKVGQEKKMDPAKVAKIGFDAMMRGDGDVVAGLKNKFQAAMAAITPETILAEQHRNMAEPGSH